MRILESWEDPKGQVFAIVRHSTRRQARFKCRPFEAMFELEGELQNFGGSPGMDNADFDSAAEAR